MSSKHGSQSRRGVLLLVVLSMLTLFMLLGVTFVILSSRVRTTAKAFLRLADDDARTAVSLKPLMKEAALQVVRGTLNAKSVIQGHDLLADKFGNSATATAGNFSFVAGGQLLRLTLDSPEGASLCGRVLTFLDGPEGVGMTSARIVDAEGTANGTVVWVPAPRVTAISSPTLPVRLNGRDFGGTGFSAKTVTGAWQTALNDSALLPNRAIDFHDDSGNSLTADLPENAFDFSSANEDYDAIDEQNMALGAADNTAMSFDRPELRELWLREYAARTGGTTALKLPDVRDEVLGAFRTKQFTGGNLTPALARLLLNLRRATLRPFAFNHFQDDQRTLDFTGKRLNALSLLVGRPGVTDADKDSLPDEVGDVDNDGDGTPESIWLDLGYPAMLMSDRKWVKPLFAIHCVDLGGRVSLNAHGSAIHAVETDVSNRPEWAPFRNESGAITKASRLRTGSGFGPADVRVDAVLSPSNMAATMLGSQSVRGAGEGIRRDLGAIVGRYADGVGSAASLPRPGQPDVNDRRRGSDARFWSDRHVPLDYMAIDATGANRRAFAGLPPDYWSRLTVGCDHRGHPLFVNRTPAESGVLRETTDNPYELDVYRSRPGNGYAWPGSPQAWIDQPYTAAELEAILRPFDFDNAAALPPRALATALAGASGDSARNRLLVTTDTWDTPAVIASGGVTFPPKAVTFANDRHDADLVRGLKMDLNRPFGDQRDNDSDGIVDEPTETGDDYSATYVDGSGNQSGWLITRGVAVPSGGMSSQPGPNEPLLRARQLYAYHIFELVQSVQDAFAKLAGAVPGLRLFAVSTDGDSDSFVPTAIDPALGNDSVRQQAHNDRVIAQWAVNIVDFIDSDAIMTPFRYAAGVGDQNVVWGCEYPDLMISETLAFHDRRTADTTCDATQEKAQQYRDDYVAAYQKYMAWRADSQGKPEPPFPNPLDPDGTPADPDDPDFDQVRIPEGSVFIELHATRNPNIPNPPVELYSFDNATNNWKLDLGRFPAGGASPVWRLSFSENRTTNPSNDVFAKLKANPDTYWLEPPGAAKSEIVKGVVADRHVWLAKQVPPAISAIDNAIRDNTFFVRDPSLSTPEIPRGGYLVIGPRPVTYLGSLDGDQQSQKWGVPSKQKIVLSQQANPLPVTVYDLKGVINPTVEKPTTAKFGNPLPPPSLGETKATWLSMVPPTNWPTAAPALGLNVTEPAPSNYYPVPTHENPASGLRDAYGPLDDDTHTSFLGTPVDRDGSRIAGKLLSGGSFANFCAVFVERLADPTRPFQPDPNQPTTWNPYVVMDFMPIDVTVFNGESSTPDPSETQGPDRGLAELLTPPNYVRAADPIPPEQVPLPFAPLASLQRRHTHFHSRQRGFGFDLQGFEVDVTLFGVGDGKQVKRNPTPFKPVSGLRSEPVIRDLQEIPPLIQAAGTQMPGGRPTQPRGDLGADEKPFFAHELGQTAAGRSLNPPSWQSVPYHSFGWVNSSFGRRLQESDGVPAQYVGAPDRPFPWLVWADRPFANPFELVYVPRVPASRLFTNYRNPDYPSATDYGLSAATYNADDLFGAATPAAHLMPLTSITDVPGSGATRSRNADLFTRLFEYVRTRSPFVGTETVLGGTNANDGRPQRFIGPFNQVPAYREPGKVNVNTITRAGQGNAVWNAICGVQAGDATPSFGQADPSSLPPFSSAVSSVLGTRTVLLPFGSGTTGWLQIPFRTASNGVGGLTASHSPLAAARLAQAWLNNPQLVPKSAADATPDDPWYVQRDDSNQVRVPSITDDLSVRSSTLLGDQRRNAGAAGRRNPLFQSPPFDAWANDPARNSWFRFETLVRANANATVRSEVYAIWVTMGLFEVIDSPSHFWHLPTTGAPVQFGQGQASPAYPDGKRLVREYGSDTGDVTRHRSFYIYDRSIPVGYEAGRDLNVQDGLLVERFIE